MLSRPAGLLPLVRWRNALAPAALGFVAGALFWHFVGFWAFVSEIIFKGPAPAQRVQGAQITTGSISPAERLARLTERSGIDPHCTALQLDRRSGATRISLCTPPRLSLPYVEVSRKTDRSVIPPRGPLAGDVPDVARSARPEFDPEAAKLDLSGLPRF